MILVKILSCAIFVVFVSTLGLTQEAGPIQSEAVWYFAASGDSRNCGDVVMPAIAEKVREDGVAFYWHLGDFRAIHGVDQDFAKTHPGVGVADYLKLAWPDFIQEQLNPFGDLPVYLGLGNHETISPKSRNEAILQFADWLDTAELRGQRLRDDAQDHQLKFYYHWLHGGVDFISLDNASGEQFDDSQMNWFATELKRAAQNPEIRSVVVGMHEALPDSLSAGHSMNESAQGTESGRRVYQALLQFRADTSKRVYLLASHSHFYMENVYDTVCRKRNPASVLPGWIVGTAGAVRYRLPAGTMAGTDVAKTDVYGYLRGAVSPDGTIRFEFRQVQENNVPKSTQQRYSSEFVQSCFRENTSQYVPDGPLLPPNCP
jgi:hypothetical protein